MSNNIGVTMGYDGLICEDGIAVEGVILVPENCSKAIRMMNRLRLYKSSGDCFEIELDQVTNITIAFFKACEKIGSFNPFEINMIAIAVDIRKTPHYARDIKRLIGLEY